MIKKLDNKGYMLVEIVLASALAVGFAYFLLDLTIKLKNKNDDLFVSTVVLTDQAIIKLGIYELLYTDTPAVVAINETVELAKKYSDEKVKNMINGVLDKIYHDSEDK